MSKLTRVRVTHQVASTRVGGQGVHNVVLHDERGRELRDLSGNLIVYTFSSQPTYIRGPLPPEIADNPLLLVEPATERDRAREPGAELYFGEELEFEEEAAATGVAPQQVEPEAPTPLPEPPTPHLPAPEAPPEAPPTPPEPEPEEDPRLRRGRELHAMPWPELLQLAERARVRTHSRKRALIEAELLQLEQPLTPGRR